MKTYKGLYPQIASFENLLLAWRKARRGKRYSQASSSFEQNLDRNLLTLYEELQSESWQPGPYRSFTVHEPKRRKISAAPFRDRVVHHALINVLEPIYEAKFIADSYANRKAKGTHRALDRCTSFMRRFRYVLPCDIEQFFPAMDHRILKAMLARHIACDATLRLCDRIIDSGAGILGDMYTLRWFAGDGLFIADRARGLPVGNLTSQFWANVYLNELDQFVKHRLRAKGYLRYVDDFLLFADDKPTLHEWRRQINDFLCGLRLTLHEGSAQPRPVQQGLGFLGFTVFPEYRLLKRRTGIAYRRYLKSLVREVRAGERSELALRASLQAWFGHIQHGDTWGLRRRVLAEVFA